MSPKKDFIPYALLFVGVFVLFSLMSFHPSDEIGESNLFGRLGFYFSYGMFYLLGSASYLIGLGLVGLGGFLFKKPDMDIPSKLIQFPVLILTSSLALSFLSENKQEMGDSGGVAGQFIGNILDFAIGGSGKAILTAFLFTYASLGIINDESFQDTKKRIWAWLRSLLSVMPISKKDLGVKFSSPSESDSSSKNSPNTWKDFLLKKKYDLNWRSEENILKNSVNLKQSKLEPVEYSPDSKIDKLYRNHSKERKIYPRYKNVSMFEGFFEESEIFRFQSAPITLKRKINETQNSPTLGFSILDYRNNNTISNKKETNLKVDNTIPDDEIDKLEPDSQLETNLNYDDNLRLFFSDINDCDKDENKLLNKYNSSYLNDSPEVEPEYLNNNGNYEEKDNIDSSHNENDEKNVKSNEYSTNNTIQPNSEYTKPEINRWDENHNENLEKDTRIDELASIQERIREDSFLPNTYVPQVTLLKNGYYISPRLLGAQKAKPLSMESKADSDLVARKIEEIISHYGIESRVISLERGPIITRYELTIPNGIKLNKITSLDSELKLYLAVKSIRIVAPIPGKSSIGIEVPNRLREDVFLMDILRESTFAKSQGGLSICIGKDIAGRPIHIDLNKLPHLLVAGTTGSGKSVSLNAMVTSLIYTRSPQELRFIMIDPKMVEMTLYEEIPHLLMPVIIDPRKATKALSWAIQEMEARYLTISKLKCRDFSGYNLKVEEWAYKKGYSKMPYIVIVIDELSDLMMVSGKELEEQIQRISQKSRAVGIHLVMATQRPSVDVITGLIKANCPARIAFQVAQKTDSRTILDTNGAEALLGKGDFLYRSPTSADLVRIQAPFVTEEEIDRIVSESKKLARPGFVEINWDEEGNGESTDSFDEDENLIEDAWRVICQEGKASGSMIQRHLRIGYNKAARIIDILEKRGIISPQFGTKPREILKSI